VGILAPAYKYGAAGPVLLGLQAARISAGIRDRAGRPRRADETPVIMVIDEAQDIATKADADTLAIGRSLGYGVIAATQTVEGVKARLGEETTAKWLSIYGSVIALANRSRETDKLVSERLGTVNSPHLDTLAAIPSVRTSVFAQNAAGSQAGGRHQSTVREALAGDDSGIVMTIIDKANPFRIIGRAMADAKDGDGDKGPSSKVALLYEPDTALVCINRARVPRRDLIELSPVYETAAVTQKADMPAQVDLTVFSRTKPPRVGGEYKEAADD
jgi:hypothetical protein